MISIKFSLLAFRIYCKQNGIRLVFAEYRKLIKTHGGRLISDRCLADAYYRGGMDAWVIEFEDDIDATAFKLKFGL